MNLILNKGLDTEYTCECSYFSERITKNIFSLVVDVEGSSDEYLPMLDIDIKTIDFENSVNDLLLHVERYTSLESINTRHNGLVNSAERNGCTLAFNYRP